MFHFLPAPILGALSGSLIVLNTMLFFVLLLPFIALKLLVPYHPFKVYISQRMMSLAQVWCTFNSGIMALTQKTQWEITGVENLNMQGTYLVTSNHYSWADIFVLQHVLGGRVPFLKFFIKQELIWVPMLGLVWWAMDMPFMKRYSKAYLAKHPEKYGHDMATTRKSCESFKDYPVAVINFLEGTRFRKHKHQNQESPYKHLLRPKAGGASLALSVMGNVLTNVVDVTLCYPENESKGFFWGLLSGKVPRIVAHVRILPVPVDVADQDYVNDKAYRERIQNWVNQLWAEKDVILSSLHKDD